MIAQVVTYKAGAFCQLKLASNERVLISISQQGIRVYQMKLLGFLPGRIIAEWSPDRLLAAIQLFADASQPSLHPLDAIKNKLMTCASVQDVERVCTG